MVEGAGLDAEEHAASPSGGMAEAGWHWRMLPAASRAARGLRLKGGTRCTHGETRSLVPLHGK